MLDFIIDVETNGFDPENPEHVEALQAMHDNGTAYTLQGFWGRLAQAALEAGIIN